MGGTPTQNGPPCGSALLVLAEAICDAQLIIVESFEQDLPDAARTLYKLRVVLGAVRNVVGIS